MRQGKVYVNGTEAGILQEDDSGRYVFSYKDDYQGRPVCLTMPIRNEEYKSDYLFPFFQYALGGCQPQDAIAIWIKPRIEFRPKKYSLSRKYV